MSTRTESSPTRSSAASTKGLVGVFRLLAEQHHEVAALFAQVQAAPERCAELWPTIRRMLISHEKGEVREVFPVLRSKPPTEADANHHDDEARELEQMITMLDETPYIMASWQALFEKIVETVLHHAAEEEQQIFPDAQAVLGEAKANELEATYTKAQMQIVRQI